MKKTLIALAVLAASGASVAQSSVSVYGLVDLVVRKDKNKSTDLTSGGLNTSRFGFRGTEDLGGGLKANFVLEQGFSIDTGAAGNSTRVSASQAFDRQSYVGLGGDFGEVKIGKMWSAYDDITGNTYPVFASNELSPSRIFATDGYIDRPTNGLYYATPSFGGISGAISTNLDEGVTTAPKISAFHVKYEGGPIFAGLAYQVEKIGSSDKKFTRINGSYDLGVVKLLGAYGTLKVTNIADTTDMSVGIDIPLSASLTVSTGYASSKPDGAARQSSYGLGAAYTLSKRTTLYAGLRNDNDAAVVANPAGNPDTRYGVGLMHTF